MITDVQKNEIIAKLIQQHGNQAKFRIEKGVYQAASLWNSQDGSAEDFVNFCMTNFLGDEKELDDIIMGFEIGSRIYLPRRNLCQ